MEDGKRCEIYSDGSYIKEIDKAGYCIVVIKDGHRKEITGSNKTEQHIKNYEIYALAKSIEVMEDENINDAILYSDALNIVRQINKKLKGKQLNFNHKPFDYLYEKITTFYQGILK